MKGYKGFKIKTEEGINNPFPYSLPEFAPAWFRSLKDLKKFIAAKEKK